MPSDPHQLLLFDIDGVIRDVAGSYRRALQATVEYYSNWRPSPSQIDDLKGEGRWNNDWDASLELLKRHGSPLPERNALIAVFSGFYFGGDPEDAPESWTGFIGDEPLLVNASLFETLHALGWAWGFVSGAEPPSARFVLEQRLGLNAPPLIAMGDAPDKPDPTGLRQMSESLLTSSKATTVAYLGDTVADVQTVIRARAEQPERTWISLAVAPPHLHAHPVERRAYEQRLMEAGADHILSSTMAVTEWLESAAQR